MNNPPDNPAAYVSPVDVAKAAGISENTVRKYLHERYDSPGPRRWMLFDVAQLDDLVTFCQSKRKRHRFNRFNAVPRDASTCS